MKALVASLILFAIVILCVTVNAVYVCKTVSEISKLAQSILKSSDDPAKINALKIHWSKHRDILELSINESRIEKMNDLIESLYAAHSAKNQPEIKKLCNLIIELCDELSQNEKISFSGLF